MGIVRGDEVLRGKGYKGIVQGDETMSRASREVGKQRGRGYGIKAPIKIIPFY